MTQNAKKLLPATKKNPNAGSLTPRPQNSTPKKGAKGYKP